MTPTARPRVLVVSHEASQTGAPRIAVAELDALATLPVERVAVLRWGGPLEPDLRQAADRTLWEPWRRTRVLLRRFRRSRRLAIALEERAARRILRREQPALVYLNTVKSACYVRPALDRGVGVVLHGHEVGALVAETLARYRLDGAYDRVRLVACSQPAAEALGAVSGPASTVQVVPSAVDISRLRLLAAQDDSVQGHPAPTGRVRVGACGTTDERKGTDLWVRMAARVHDRLGAAAPSFVWIGGEGAEPYERQADQAGLGDSVQFIGPIDNPYPLLASLSILTVTSRADAFPLVVLEAMALGVPVVAFEVGGIKDQVGPDGVLVPGGDVDAMADAVIRLLADGSERRRLADAAARRVERLYGIDRLHETVATIVAEELSRS